MDKELQWLKTQESMLKHRISYQKSNLINLENDLSAVREIINKMEQSEKLPRETNADPDM